VERSRPLIAVISQRGDQEIVRYLSSEAEAREAVSPEAIQRALALPGAWADMDWEEMEENLHRIRHANPPSPSLTIDE